MYRLVMIIVVKLLHCKECHSDNLYKCKKIEQSVPEEQLEQ